MKSEPIVIKGRGCAHCPKCGKDIHGMGKMIHCPYCGQPIDWSKHTYEDNNRS